jgi:hypothetical protein
MKITTAVAATAPSCRPITRTLIGAVGVSAKDDDNINYMGLVTVPSLGNDFSYPICKIAGVDNVSAVSLTMLPAVQKVATH